MSDISTFLELELLDHVLRPAAYSAPASVFAHLYTSATTDAGGGTEVTGGAYGAIVIVFATNAAGSPGLISNTSDVDFVTATANWGTVSHMAIEDAAATSANFLFHGDLVASKVVNSGDTFKFLVGDIDVSLD